jgi:hypothetical protein
MATSIFLMNAQTTQSTGFTGPGLAPGVDDTEAATLISQALAAPLTWQGDD